MRSLKYVALVLLLLLSAILPLGSAYADSGSQVRILSRASVSRCDGGPASKSSVDPQQSTRRQQQPDNGHNDAINPQQFTPLTGMLRPPEAGAKRYAIVVGSNYTSLPDNTAIPPFVPPFGPHLNWAQADAQAMAGLLSGLGFDRVIALVGSGSTGASRANILKAIQTVKQKAKEGDEVVFYFSGHGAQLLRSETGKGWGVASEGIVTDEGTTVKYLWDNDLERAFNDFETNRIVFIFDSCFSGGMTQLSGEGRLILVATSKDGIAVEDAGPNDPSNLGIDHGLFTFFLLAALTGNALQADALVNVVMGTNIQNPYDPKPTQTVVSMEQAFDYASFDLQAVTPLVYGGLAYYYGADIASHWATPEIIDRFRGDLVL